MQAESAQGQRYLFIGIWVIASIFLGWQLGRPPYSFDSRLNGLNLIVILLCSVALLAWIPNPMKEDVSQKSTKRGLFFLLILASASIFLLVPTRAVRVLLFVLPAIAIIALLLLKQPVEKREGLYALALALLAGVTGLGAGWITFVTPALWGILQVFLVLTGLLAGWSILQQTGLAQDGIGKSRFLSDGAAAGFKAFISGIVIAMPWAFLNVVAGASNRETWVKVWWQPITALQPGIAEEAWGRILLVPLFFLIFRRVAPPRAAFTAALYVMAYWFSYLHTPGGLNGIPSTVLIGTLAGLPVSYLCMYRDLETAMGWHFWVDFIKFVFAFILFN